MWKFEKSRLPRFFFFSYSSVFLFLSLFFGFLSVCLLFMRCVYKKIWIVSFHLFRGRYAGNRSSILIFLLLFSFVSFFFYVAFFFFFLFFFCMKTIAEEPDFLISSFSLISFVIRKIWSINLFFSVNSTFYDNVWINKIKSIRSKNLFFVFWMAKKRNNWFILPLQKTNFFFFLKMDIKYFANHL